MSKAKEFIKLEETDLRSLPGNVKSALTRAEIITPSSFATTKIITKVETVGDVIRLTLGVSELSKPEILSLAKSSCFTAILHTPKGLVLKFKA